MATKLAHERFTFLMLLAVLLLAFSIMMRPFWIPAGLAIVTVMVCRPLYWWISARCRRRRYLAALIALLLVCTFVLIPLGGILATVVVEIIRFAQHFAEQLQGGQLAARIDQFNLWLTQVLSGFGDFAPAELNLRVSLLSTAKFVAKTLYQFSPKVLASTAHVGIAICFWLLFVFVFFAEGDRLYAYFMELFPLSSAHEKVIAKEVREVVSAALLAMVATSTANGLLMGLMFWVAPLEQPVVWGLVTFGLSFIPVVGAFSVWLGAALYLVLVGQAWWAVGICAFGLIIVAQTDNIIKPLVMRGRVDIHPALLLVSLLGGAAMMGPSGLIFGPVFVAVLLACLRIYRREFT